MSLGGAEDTDSPWFWGNQGIDVSDQQFPGIADESIATGFKELSLISFKSLREFGNASLDGLHLIS